MVVIVSSVVGYAAGFVVEVGELAKSLVVVVAIESSIESPISSVAVEVGGLVASSALAKPVSLFISVKILQ